jgi:hypothetical protein
MGSLIYIYIYSRYNESLGLPIVKGSPGRPPCNVVQPNAPTQPGCWVRHPYYRRFETGGVPKPTSECAACPSPDGSSAWASAKGGEARWPETDVREVEIPRPSCSSRAQVGCACSRGVTSVHVGEGSERPQESACLVLGPARPTFSKKALVLPFIVVRRGSRCTVGGVAECSVSSGERASALGTCQCGSRRGLGTLLA